VGVERKEMMMMMNMVMVQTCSKEDINLCTYIRAIVFSPDDRGRGVKVFRYGKSEQAE